MTVLKGDFNLLHEFTFNRTVVVKMNPHNFTHKNAKARNVTRLNYFKGIT